MKERKDFILLAKARSGSTWVIDVLNNHPEFEVFDEVFHPSEIHAYRNFGSQRMDYFKVSDCRKRWIRPLSTRIYLNQLFEPDHPVGFKMLYHQASQHSEVLLFAILRRLKVIHLVRENQLDALISLEVAKATKRWHLIAGDEEDPVVPRIHLDTGRLISMLESAYRQIARVRMLLRLFCMPHLEVSYEKLKADPGVFHEIWHFPGAAPPHELQTKHRLIRTQSYPKIIANWPEVRDCLAASTYRHLIE